MRDFTPVTSNAVSMASFIDEWNPNRDELARLTDASIDRFLELLATASDADVVFVPDDPDANDDAAGDAAERDLAWTIAHNIVHATASGDEYSALAAELARGVDFHGRSRYETPWRSITTVAQCRQRLEESRRIRQASLAMWPDRPDLSRGYAPWRRSGWVNAQGIFVWGLIHDQSHHAQVEGIVRQIEAARTADAAREPVAVGASA
ncbi:MAG TPA: DinB family protein [Thermomicrobiales bacterium]|nr:DinB family protein [Thermomicrobiales bacterium]